VRWRVLEDERQRIEVEHIQSGLRSRVEDAAAAIAWMAAHVRAAMRLPESGPEPEPAGESSVKDRQMGGVVAKKHIEEDDQRTTAVKTGVAQRAPRAPRPVARRGTGE
jgi:hypothetical protein